MAAGELRDVGRAEDGTKERDHLLVSMACYCHAANSTTVGAKTIEASMESKESCRVYPLPADVKLETFGPVALH